MLLLASDDQSERLARSTAQQPPQQDLLLALSFCRAVCGLTFRKGRSGMLRWNNEVIPLAAVSHKGALSLPTVEPDL
jgi:hypothetical protein